MINEHRDVSHDAVLALLSDAMELIATAHEEYAEALRYQEVDARVEEGLREVIADEATVCCIRQNGIGSINSIEITR